MATPVALVIQDSELLCGNCQEKLGNNAEYWIDKVDGHLVHMCSPDLTGLEDSLIQKIMLLRKLSEL